MNPTDLTYRRSFLGRVFGAVAAAGFMGAGPAGAQNKAPAAPAARATGPDAWIGEVKGTHRCLFDFPQHKNGVPLLHILNYLNTYNETYKAAPGTVGAVGTFYSIGNQASISLAFNDAMWAKYGLGDYTGMKDASGKGYTRNVLYRPTKDDGHVRSRHSAATTRRTSSRRRGSRLQRSSSRASSSATRAGPRCAASGTDGCA